MLISVIIPVYNTFEYLEQCLNSICNQTYKNIEIICIDDGSYDGSSAILDRIASNDKRIIVIHQDNHGESNARNVGLRIATGDYITFCDCDDWLEEDMYENLMHLIESYNVDISIGSWFKDSLDESKPISNILEVSKSVFGRDELLKYIYQRDSYQGFAYMWNKLYRRELFFDKHHKPILFDEDLRLGGDVLFLARIALNTKSAMYIQRPFYHYRQRIKSGCHEENVEKRMDWIKSYQRVIELFEREKVDNFIMDYVKRFMAYHCSNTAEIAYKQNKREEFIYCIDIMKKNKDIYEKTNIDYPQRIRRFNDILSINMNGE